MELNQSLVDEILNWFATYKRFVVELPNGYYGRPWDDQYELTSYLRGERYVVLELSGRILLVFDRVGSIKSEKRSESDVSLTISDFVHLTYILGPSFEYLKHLDRYVSGPVDPLTKPPEVKTYASGSVIFTANTYKSPQ